MKEYNVHVTKQKVLIVEDDKLNRELLREILSGEYEVFVAKNGREALEILEEQASTLSLVMTDLQMPVMDGYALISEMNSNPQYTHIPIIAITGAGIEESSEKDAIEISCLEMGASDFVRKPYNPRVVLNRVKSIIRLKASTNLLQNLEKDSLTGLYTKEFFYNMVERLVHEDMEENLVMWVSDIEGLKIINEKYGIEMGDEVLRRQAIDQQQMEGFLFGGRIEGDKLAALVKETALPLIKEKAQQSNMGIEFPVPNVVINHGIYPIRSRSSLQAQGMYDRALLALQKIKDTYGTYIAEYDDELRQDLLRQRQVAESAETALEEHQFIVYYQPKYNPKKEQTDGAEALIRWRHPDLGFMNPNIFIPLFERNGFIKKLDFYVWREVCSNLREWKNKGMRVVPISVNFSRRDFEDPELADKVIAMVDWYGLDHSLFHIELTESSYSDNPERIVEVIKKFHENGFVVELDDFGTGYSSMTALSELDIDVVKLDMSIVQNDDPSSNKSVLGFSMQLAHMMKFKTVAEGVETQAQVERIVSLGGDYIQGYYYSKPITKEEFEDYLRREQEIHDQKKEK